MKKVGAKLLLCMMLCFSMISSGFTVFADEGSAISKLDLSGFKSIDIRDIGGVYDGKFYLSKGYSYCIIYYDGDDFRYYIQPEGEEEQCVDASSDKISAMIRNTDSYFNYAKDDGKYCYICDADMFDTNDVKSFLLFAYDEEKDSFSIVGHSNNDSEKFNKDNSTDECKFFASMGSINDMSKLDLEKKPPVPNVNVIDKKEDSATINVKYTSEFGVYSVVCSSNGNDLYTQDVDEKSRFKGEYNFKVTSNGDYTIECYISPYMSKSEKHSEVKVKVDNISEVVPEDKEVSADDTAPVVTFDLPESASDGSDVFATMHSSEPSMLSFNGQVSDGYVTEMQVVISSNGDYHYGATDESGNSTEDYLNVSLFKDDFVAVTDANRDSFWGDEEVVDSLLPQTGGIGFTMLVTAGVGLVVAGLCLVIKNRNRDKNSSESN